LPDTGPSSTAGFVFLDCVHLHRSDTVAEIADLARLNARTFFDETYITVSSGVNFS
jgi:hypothetical protein